MITEVREYLKAAPANRLLLPHAAEALGVSPSGLAAKIRAQGTSFTTLRDAERRDRVQALLRRNRHADAAAIRRVTGFAEAQASRSIKRWFGATLPQLRGSV